MNVEELRNLFDRWNNFCEFILAKLSEKTIEKLVKSEMVAKYWRSFFSELFFVFFIDY